MSNKPVIIVGAGIAGLFCAELLNTAGIPVLVLEAAPFIGGRVKSVKFVDWGWKLADVGADFVHGERTLLKRYVDMCGFPYRKLFTWAQGDGPAPAHHIGGGAAMYWLGKKKKLVRWDADDEDVTLVNDLLWSIGNNELDPNDKRSLETYLKENGVSDEGMGLAEAGYANTMCSSSDRLPLYGVIHLEHAWNRDGGGDFRLDNSMSEVINHMARGLKIKPSWKAVEINYFGNEGVTVKNDKGEVIEGSAVVCTIPLTILKREEIKFNPPLPRERQLAISTLQMYSSVKIAIEFAHRFWPKEMHGMICSHSFIPEFWFEDPDRIGALMPASIYAQHSPLDANKKPSYLVTGFACAKFAEKMSTMKKDEIIAQTLAQLDEIFSGVVHCGLLRDNRPGSQKLNLHKQDCETCINPKNPATLHYIDAMVVDWGKNPLIGGGYSSPSFGESTELRKVWTEPIQDKVYFAGEAYNKDSIMTLHGAMETSLVAATNILKSRGMDPPAFGSKKRRSRSKL